MKNLHENVRQLTIMISELSGFIYDNEDEFLQRFAKFDYTDLTEVSFGYKYLRFTYVEHSGDHICDSICIEEFTGWCDKLSKQV